MNDHKLWKHIYLTSWSKKKSCGDNGDGKKNVACCIKCWWD